MANGPETRFRLGLSKGLRNAGAWAITIHGGMFQSGIPDLLGAIRGQIFAIELKAKAVRHLDGIMDQVDMAPGPTGKAAPTALQMATLHDVRRAGGRALVAVMIFQDRKKAYQLWACQEDGLGPILTTRDIGSLIQTILTF